MGAYKNPLICDEKEFACGIGKIAKCKKLFAMITRLLPILLTKNTFVYFDPPYRPITDTASFTAYTENLFNDEEQIELAHFVDDMHGKRC